MRNLLVCLCFVLVLPTGARFQSQQVPLDSAWIIDPQVWNVAPIQNSSTIQFHWQVSPTVDPVCGLNPETPNTSTPGYGYLLRPWTTPITGSSITATLTLKVKSGSPVFNYIRESGNTCCYPAHVRLYFQTGGLYNATPGTRWWSNPGAIDLASSLGHTETLTVSLDPSLWSDAQGHSGLIDGGFYAALASPTYVGLTFGGGCFFGHGINTSGGKVQFNLSQYDFGLRPHGVGISQ